MCLSPMYVYVDHVVRVGLTKPSCPATPPGVARSDYRTFSE